MIKSDFVIWGSEPVKNACVLYSLDGVEDTFELSDGVSRAANFGDSATYTMDPNFPNDTILVDHLFNTDFRIVGSLRLKEFLDSRHVTKVEYLPVTILNHKNKPASKDYFIIHPIEPVECLDAEKSGARWSRIDKTRIDKVERLVVDEEKIDPDRVLFRAKAFHRVILTRRNLAEAITAAGFTGIKWIELTNYPRPQEEEE
jgi:hypothetical protein